MTTPAYRRKPDPVAAILWTGYNFPDVEQFFRDWVPAMVADEQGPYNEPDEGWPTERFTYNTVQYYDGDDDRSVDPGNWIIVHTDIPENVDRGIPRIEAVGPDDFRRDYEAA